MAQQDAAPGPALSRKSKPVRVTVVGSEISLFFPSAAFPQLWVGFEGSLYLLCLWKSQASLITDQQGLFSL